MEYNQYLKYVETEIGEHMERAANCASSTEAQWYVTQYSLGEAQFTPACREAAGVLGKLDTLKGIKHKRRRVALQRRHMWGRRDFLTDPDLLTYLGRWPLPVPKKYQ